MPIWPTFIRAAVGFAVAALGFSHCMADAAVLAPTAFLRKWRRAKVLTLLLSIVVHRYVARRIPHSAATYGALLGQRCRATRPSNRCSAYHGRQDGSNEPLLWWVLGRYCRRASRYGSEWGTPPLPSAPEDWSRNGLHLTRVNVRLLMRQYSAAILTSGSVCESMRMRLPDSRSALQRTMWMPSSSIV